MSRALLISLLLGLAVAAYAGTHLVGGGSYTAVAAPTPANTCVLETSLVDGCTVG